MSLFTWMLAGHLVGDFLLQTSWMANNKTTKPLALFAHSLTYTATISLLALFSGGLAWYAIALLFLSHILLDNRQLVLLWCKYITKSDSIPWMLIVADQTWHVLILAFACVLSGG